MTERVVVDGVGLEYRWIGPGPDQAPTLVFLHEGLGCLSLWRDVPDTICAAVGWGGLVYSRWGYGHSDPRPLPWPIDHMEREGIDVVPRLLDALGVGDHVLWGHSDGGTIALVSAGHHDDPRLRGVFGVAAHVFAGEEIATRSIEAAVEWWENGDLRTRMARHHADPEGAFWGWAGTWLHPDFATWSVERFLPNITVPVVALQGTADQYGTWAQVERICAAVPHARPMPVPGATHHPYVDDLEAVVAATVEFVGGL